MTNFFSSLLARFGFASLFSVIILTSFAARAEEQFPNVTGEIISKARFAFINGESPSGSYKRATELEVEPKFSVNINEEWSVKNSWRLAPFKSREEDNYQINQVFPSENQPTSPKKYGLAVEEIKGDFRNEDMNIFFGKYNATFGKAWEEDRRIGVFAHDYTKDYQLKEKIGAGVAALLDDGGAVTLNVFFNDTTPLSNTALNKRGTNKTSDGYAGNKRNLTSYSVTVSGNNFLNVEDLHYNFGYRDLDVDGKDGFDNERGFVAGFEYYLPLNYKTYFVPFIEVAKFNNYYGVAGRDALYATVSMMIKYSNWQGGVSYVKRNIKSEDPKDTNDSQTQYFVGYKFKNGITIDASHASVKEGSASAKIIGVATGYNYKF